MNLYHAVAFLLQIKMNMKSAATLWICVYADMFLYKVFHLLLLTIILAMEFKRIICDQYVCLFVASYACMHL